MLLLLCSLTAQAADNLITEQVVVNVKSAGTLSSLIKKADRTRITNLKVTGKVNSQDLEWLRRMACCHDSQNNKETGNLQHLDLLDAKIIGGGDVVVYVPRHNAPSKLKAELKDDTFCSYLFTESKTLKSIILPKTLKSIESSVFSCCDSLTSVVLPEGLTYMEGGVFAGCTSLTSVTLPSTLKKIDGTSTFKNCTSLTSVSLPEDMVYFYGYTFEGCTGVTSFHVDEANPNYSSEGTVLFNKNKNKIIYALGHIEDYKVPASVDTIGASSFQDQSDLIYLTLPEGLKIIEEAAFTNSDKLKCVYAYMPEPATLEDFSFATTVTGDFIYLYVPQGCSRNYFCDPSWSRFYIQEFDVTGTDVKSAVAGDDAKEVARYTVNGQRIKSPTRGINIVKYDDGTVKRVVVK